MNWWRNGILVLCVLTASGCHYLDPKYNPPGFSSTHHKYEVEERVREWHAREEKRKKIAALQRKIAQASAEQPRSTKKPRTANNEMSAAARAR